MGILPPPQYPQCFEAATKKLTFSTTSVLLPLNVPLSLSRGTIFRQQKIPEGGTAQKEQGFYSYVRNPEGQYHTVPTSYAVVRRPNCANAFTVHRYARNVVYTPA